jgi:hypothetical protein
MHVIVESSAFTITDIRYTMSALLQSLAATATTRDAGRRHSVFAR